VSGKTGTNGDEEGEAAAGGSAAAAVGRRWKSAKRRSAQRLAARQATGGGGGLGRRCVAGGREKANGAELGRERRLWTPSIAGGRRGRGRRRRARERGFSSCPPVEKLFVFFLMSC